NSTTQISEGLTQGLGIDIKSLLTGALGGATYAAAAGKAKDGSANAESDAEATNEDSFKEVTE
ncbi:MAG: flotillin family protein, partial [Lachnospiraceae bacterium]|nr:flotillin family protein [Lachnospiraceae bacterium]